MTKLEKEIEQALVKMISRHGGCCLKWTCPGWAGVPDRIVLLPGGIVIFVELKRPKGGKRPPMQIWWSRKLRDLGFLHFWVQNDGDITAMELLIRDMQGRRTP